MLSLPGRLEDIVRPRGDSVLTVYKDFYFLNNKDKNIKDSSTRLEKNVLQGSLP